MQARSSHHVMGLEQRPIAAGFVRGRLAGSQSVVVDWIAKQIRK
jgi:hypothetical protein